MRQREGTMERLFTQKSEIGMLARSLDWSATSLGPLTNWQQSLKTAVSMCLNCPVPGVVWWGSEFISFYNDACKSILGSDKYRAAIGQIGSHGWSKIWHLIAPGLHSVLATGEVSDCDTQRFSLYCGDVYYKVSHSPIFDERGKIGGVFTVFTESKEPEETEAQLQESRYFIEKIAETIPGILYVYDLVEERNIYVNKQITKILGYSEEWVKQVCSNLLPILLHPEDLAKLPEYMSKFEQAEDGEIIELEYRMQHSNGEWRWFHGRGVVFSRTASGAPKQILGIAADISENKEREIALRASEERFRLVTEAANGLIFDWDLQSGEVYRSAQLYDLIGVPVSEAEPIPCWWHQRIHPEDMARFKEVIPHLLTGDRVLCESEYRLRHERGHWINVWERSRLVRNDCGEVIRILGCTIDISDRVRSQTELSLLIETIPQQIWRALPNGEIDYVNSRCGERFGVTLEQVRSWGWTNFIHPEDLPLLLHKWKLALKNGCFLEMETRILCADGEYRWFLAQAVPLYNERGEIVKWYGTNTDIHARLEAEKNLRQSQIQLQQQLAEIEAIYQTAPIGLAILDKDLRFLRINRRLAEINGLSAEIHIGRRVRELLPQLAGTAEPLLLGLIETAEPLLNVEIQGETPALPGVNRVWLEHFLPLKNGEEVTGISIVCEEITDRIRIESALRESEEKFRQLAENIVDMVFWIYDMRVNKVIYVSSAYERVWGISSATLLENPPQWLEVIHPDDIEAVRQTIVERDISGSFELKYRIIRPDGSGRWIHDRGFPILDSSGKPYRIVGIAEDITPSINAETALKETSDRLNLALKSAPLSLFNQDRDLRYTWIYNPTHNFTIEDIIGRRDEDLTSAPSAAELTRIKTQVLSTGIGTRKEVKLVNGQNISYYDLTVEPIRDDNEDIIGVTCAAVDISERVKAEEALRQSEARLKQLVELNLLGVMFWHINGEIIDANDAFLNMIGYTRSELEAGLLNWRAITQPEQIHISETSLLRMRRNASDSIEKEYIRKDGKRVPVLLGGVMFKDSEELGVSFVVDMTEQKRAEVELQLQASELKKLNSALKQTTAKLTQRNQELDCFVYTVSHDLKAPLRAISNLTDWLAEDLQDKLDEDNLRQMQLLQNRVVRMASLIDGLLVYSRIGRTEVATEDVNVNQLIAEIIDSLAPPPSFRISVEARLPVFSTRKLLLFQVLSNLIGNAIKHNDKGEGNIDISARFDGEVYRFSVADNGPGIEKQNQERIFGIFQTLKSRDVQENTGIGLSIVKKIVETEGGSIWLDSEPGKGSLFSFTWPPSSGESQVGDINLCSPI